jgi:hypothetical protein
VPLGCFINTTIEDNGCGLSSSDAKGTGWLNAEIDFWMELSIPIIPELTLQ